MVETKTRVLIIGAGPAGYSAAIYAARANLKPTLVTGIQPGGQLTTTTDVENFPGFAQAVQGPELMEQMRQQAEHVGTSIVFDTIMSVDLSQDPIVAQGDSGDTYLGDALIIATGAQAKWLGSPGEADYSGYGISACAVCDGFFYRGKEVVVIGGGNTAVEEALYLTNHASKVTLIHRRDKLRAEQILQDRFFAHPKIEVLWNTEVMAFLGEGEPSRRLTGLRLLDRTTGVETSVSVGGAFVAIGHDPATALFRGQLDMTDAGYIKIAPWSTATSRKNVWSAGDVSDDRYKQAVVAAGMGCMAALEAEKYLAERTASQPTAEKARKARESAT
ncbi:thioredoxin-disulfide reductase [Bradyrhizobium sp. CCBAU 53421]|uniref:thioredoxin-disulfide reductase n=1 Tax=Bradyrhizobium sp. CCBAU 53421 TaxID=1325120 RepID=UPI00188B2E9D|nr:thioredoxin-disulfide reductase [Bradyrhizobium sp. CCBAU 53421]QOZ38457.1 thioredoxin-disulfide reductase [Bradyrhizobium sp. CCBAU 53421]